MARNYAALRQLQRDYPGAYVFATERGGPMTTATVRKMIARAGEVAKLLPDSPAHAAPRLRLQTRKRRARHTGAPALPRAQEHPAHGAIYRDWRRIGSRISGGIKGEHPQTAPQDQRAALDPIAALRDSRPLRATCMGGDILLPLDIHLTTLEISASRAYRARRRHSMRSSISRIWLSILLTHTGPRHRSP